MFKNLQGHPSLLLLALFMSLSGCSTVVLNPSGDIASQQGHLVMIATALMLLVVVPVLFLTLYFAWRYRHTNTKAVYDPEWDHSTQLELVIWAVPLLIIIVLGALTWISTHTLDPYRPLSRLDAERPIVAENKPLVIEVVALDWKWLFLYPKQGIATVNELAAPVDMPIQFKVTASSVMNSFYIPALAGQIYAMPGMQTQLHAVINEAGDYKGFSANYSGAGFSGMHFRFYGMKRADFDQWVNKVQANGEKLDRETYLLLEKPSEHNPVRQYATVMTGLYDAILNRCVENDRMCMKHIMAIDAGGGMGLAGIKLPINTDGHSYVPALVCTVDNPDGLPQLLVNNASLE